MADLRALTRFSTTSGASIDPRLVLDTDRIAAGGMVLATAASTLSFQTTGANSDIALSATRNITLGATTGYITLSAVDTSSITLSANSALAKTFTIAVTNVGGGTGDISITAANGAVTVSCTGTATFGTTGKTYISPSAGGSINIGNSATPTNLSVYSAAATISANLTSALQLVSNDPAAQTLTITCSNAGIGDGNLTMSCKSTMDVDCATYTLDATGALSIDSALSSNLTVGANAAAARTLTVSCTNAGAGTGNLTFSCKSAASVTSASFAVNCTANISETSSAGMYTAQAAGNASLISTAAATYVTGFTQTEVTATQGYLGLFSTYNNAAGYVYISSVGSYIRLHDVYKNTSTYVNAFHLSDAQAEWDNYVTNFGQVSLLSALNQCAGSSVTLQEAYDAGTGTITLDASGVFLINLDSATGNTFKVASSAGGADSLLLTSTGANAMSLQADVTTCDVNASSTITLDAVSSSNLSIAANSAGAITLTLSCTNAGAGQGNVTVTCEDILTLSTTGSAASSIVINSIASLDMDCSQCTLDSTGGISIDASSGSNFTVTSNSAGTITLTLSCTNAGVGAANLTVSCDDLLTLVSTSNNIDMDCRSFTLDTTTDISIDTVGSSNFTVAANSGGAVTLMFSCTNAGVGSANLTVTCDDLLTITSTSNNIDMDCRSFTLDTTTDISIDTVGSSNFTVAASSAGAVTLTVNATNAGAGAANLTLACKSTMDLDCAYYTLDTTSSFSLDAAASSNINISGNIPGNLLLTLGCTNAAGLGNIDLTCKSTLNIDCTDCTLDATAAISFDSATASNFTVSGAAADLTLGARAATITLNEAGNTTLSGFTATSIVGALNELKASGGSSTSVTTTIPAGASTVNAVATTNDTVVEWFFLIQFGANIRGGVLTAVCDHSAAAARLYETVTTDIGVTTDVAFGASHDGANLNLTAANGGANTYNFKAIRRKVSL